MAAATPPPASASGTSTTTASPLSYTHAYAGNLLTFDVVSAITIITAVLGIWYRRSKGRLTLIQRTARAEGVYWVPNVPILSAICIIIFCIMNLIWCSTLYLLYAKSQKVSIVLVRIVTLGLPFPLFAWAHFSSFGPVYACHLFPLETTAAVRPRLARFLRFSPCVINGLCFFIPLLAFVPALALSISWAVTSVSNDRLVFEIKGLSGAETSALLNQFIVNHRALVQQYRAQWCLWAVCFTWSGTVYALYSSLLLPTLKGEIDKLRDISGVQSTIGLNLPQAQTFSTTSSSEDHKVDPSSPLKRPGMPAKHASASWLRKGRMFSYTWYSDHHGRRLSKFDLLKVNSRIVSWELFVFSFFCIVWIIIALVKAIAAKAVLASGDMLAATLIAEGWAGLAFGFTMCALICKRGYNASRVASSPDPQNALTKIVSRDLVFLSSLGSEQLGGTVDDEKPFDAAYVAPMSVRDLDIDAEAGRIRAGRTAVHFEGGETDLITALSSTLLAPQPTPSHSETNTPLKSLWSPPIEWEFPENEQETATGRRRGGEKK